jgi:L-alanine-DL-glutamate epimerase-like enolase superfamily enzyme
MKPPRPAVPARTPVTSLSAEAFTIPTDLPEADGTIAWNSTTIVVVHVDAGGCRGLGYAYADASAAILATSTLAALVVGADAFDIEHSYGAMRQAVRNLGRDGIAASAVSAVDAALWDLKARLLNLPLVSLLGAVRDGVAAYGSGGFTSYSVATLMEQLSGWVAEGIGSVKMKVGRNPTSDRHRVKAAREAIGVDPGLFVDANGAYDRKLALFQAERFAEERVSWFEEPVSSDDRAGLRLLCERAPAGMEIAAGEYGYEIQYFRQLLETGSVDVLQADATRCGGVTGFLRAAALADAFCVPLSAHTAPSLHGHLGCAVARLRHVEYFHDHARIEQLLFDGALRPIHGQLQPDRSRPGTGLELKRADAERLTLREGLR